ncbi:MAG TPA: TonB family protein [Lentisphaeria bacterium]|nr:TonB family protein [Lentisphaeria bacterium]
MTSSKAQILVKVPLACLAAFLALASIFILPLFHATRPKPPPVIARKVQLARIDTTDGRPANPAVRQAPARVRASLSPRQPQFKLPSKPPKIPSPAPTKAFIRVPQIQLPALQPVTASPVPIPEPLAPTEPIVFESSDFGPVPAPQFLQSSASQTAPVTEGAGTPLATSLKYPPTPIRQRKPTYPQRYRNQGISGFVVAQFTVKASGDVDAISITESSPQGFFDDSAKRAIATWKFNPGRNLAGEPVDCIVQIRLDFNVVSR